MSVSTAVKDGYALKLGADHIINNWGFDRNLVRLTGKAGEGCIGAAACAFFGMDVPMMKEVVAYAAKINPGVPKDKRDIRTVQAWVKFGMIRDALAIADKKGKLDGPTIKGAFESFKGWQPFGKKGALGRPPVTYTATDHRPSSEAMIYWIKDGKIQLLRKIDMKKQFPDKWASWLGW
jgi:branched-chain amino acid transport system substrate-binding protein